MNALQMIQAELKAPKDQYNAFGKYKYRSAESILEAVKPLLKKYNATLFLYDTIEEVGGRVYVCAHACLSWEVHGNPTDHESITPCRVEVKAYAREPEEKKGMDDSQVTGTASSYARKYALNGLFLIDDAKDPDSNEYHAETTQNGPQKATRKAEPKADAADVERLRMMAKLKKTDEAAICKAYRVKALEEMTAAQVENAFRRLGV